MTAGAVEPPILKWFNVEEPPGGQPVVPVGFPVEVATQFGKLAVALVNALPAGPELSTSLRKLLESRDAAVRAAIEVAS